MTLALTKQQEKLWRYIKGRERSPTYAEMVRDLGLNSRSQIFQLVEQLEKRGYVKKSRATARSIVALDPHGLHQYSTRALLDEIERRTCGKRGKPPLYL